MGEAYLAQDTKLDWKVALKILPAERAANGESDGQFCSRSEVRRPESDEHPDF